MIRSGMMTGWPGGVGLPGLAVGHGQVMGPRNVRAREDESRVGAMVDFTISLPDEQAGRLRELASEAGVSPEELLRDGAREGLTASRASRRQARFLVASSDLARILRRIPRLEYRPDDGFRPGRSHTGQDLATGCGGSVDEGPAAMALRGCRTRHIAPWSRDRSGEGGRIGESNPTLTQPDRDFAEAAAYVLGKDRGLYHGGGRQPGDH